MYGYFKKSVVKCKRFRKIEGVSHLYSKIKHGYQ